MMRAPRAYLWTPRDVVELDLGPFRAREQHRLTCLLRSGRIIPRSMLLRTKQLLVVLDELIHEVGTLPPHDGAVAEQRARQLDHWATLHRLRWPGWVYARAAAHIRYRLLPHAISHEWDEAHERLVPPRPAHTARAAVLRNRGLLVIVEPIDTAPKLSEREVPDAGPAAF